MSNVSKRTQRLVTPGFRRLKTAVGQPHTLPQSTLPESFSEPPEAAMPRPKASVKASRINGGKASNKGVAKSKVKVLEVTSHGGKRVVEHVELPKLPKGYGAYFTELAARRRAEQAAMLLDDIKNAPEDKKLLELAHGMDAEDAESILSSFSALTGTKVVISRDEPGSSDA